jgi:hypothetical protein
MKKLLDRWRNRKHYLFEEMSAWLLVVIGGGAFLVSGYTGLALSDIVPVWISTVNKIGYLDAIGTAIGLFYCCGALHFGSSPALRPVATVSSMIAGLNSPMANPSFQRNGKKLCFLPFR